jgi:hypothetical protein
MVMNVRVFSLSEPDVSIYSKPLSFPTPQMTFEINLLLSLRVEEALIFAFRRLP